ncbi:MAG: nucleotidyltransferase family protein [Firmicutes bacterium]|nr:nucleotidyltransferase family protein [Bacillota bacterium]
MNAIVLAGGKAEGMRGRDGYRAGLVVGGRSLLEQALRALAGLPDLGRVVLVGPEELVPEEYRLTIAEVLRPGDDLFTNLKRGLAVLPVDEPVLVLSSDLPLLTRAALLDFVRQCGKREAEVYYPIIRREIYEEAYPGSRRTYVRVRDGTFTGGNVALLTPAAFLRHEKLFARAIAHRKHPLRLAPLLGLGLLPRLFLRSLTVAEIEARVAARLGLRAAAIESRFSEMGFDVDTEADLEWIEFYWGGALMGEPRIEPELEGE